jgi:glyoxylate carboligase
MKLTGAQIMMAVLKEEGVDTIFGFPGGAVIDIYDESDMSRAPYMRPMDMHAPVQERAFAWSHPARVRQIR